MRVGFDHPRVGVVHERQAEAHTARERDGTRAPRRLRYPRTLARPIHPLCTKITGDDVSTLIARTGGYGTCKKYIKTHPGDAKFLQQERDGDPGGDGEASRRFVGPLDELGGVRGCL